MTLTGVASAATQRASVARLGGQRVLAVDDNATNRTILGEQLATGGLSVTVVADGPSALEALSDAARDGRAFVAAILDMHMPGMDGLMLAAAIRAVPSIASTPLVLLTSVEEHGQTDQFAAVLTKPARQSQLLETLASVLGIAAPTRAVARPKPVDIADAGALTGPLVLVAEDTGFSQLVARRLLERLACRVDVVANGYEAVAAVKAVASAAVMMDVRMPEMDGFEATSEIRRREAATGQERIPIIAMTANALEGDKEHCLAAGMDDYISKPVRLQELEVVVRRWVKFDDGEPVAA